MTPTVEVTVTLAAQDGTPYEGVTVRARLDGNEVYEGIVISDQAEAVTDAAGVAILDLFPNAPSPTGLGTQGTTYRFLATIPGGRSLNVEARVPNTDCRLENILVGDEVGPLSDAELALLQAQAAVTRVASGVATAAASAASATASAAAAAASEAAADSSETAAAASATAAAASQVTASAAADVASDYSAAAAASAQSAATSVATVAGNAADGRGVNLADYTALRAYAGAAFTITITGYLVTTAPSGIAGQFTRDDADVTSADNGGTIIVATNGVRWKRAHDGVLSAAWFGVVGDYEPGAGTGTDDTVAMGLAFSALAASTTARTLIFAKQYYKVTGGLTFPANMSAKIIDFQGARIYYKGASDSAAAFLKQTAGQVTRNIIANVQFYGEDNCGYFLYVAGATGNIVFSENIFRNVEIVRPKVRGIQLGKYSVTGFDVDAATNTFEHLRFRLETGQEGIEIDADNAFSTYMAQVFGGGWGSSAPGTYIRQKVGSGLHIVSLFTGDNAFGVAADRSDATYAVELNDGNTTIEGWQVEGSCILKMTGFAGERRQVKVSGVEINDSIASSVATYAIYAPNGVLLLDNARLGRTIHPRMIYCGDTLTARNVDLGASADNTVLGRYNLDHPERCNIEGRRLSDPINRNGNPNFHLWWGSAADDLPLGYEKSALGACVVTRSTSNPLYTQYTARVNISVGAAVSGQLIDGLISRATIGSNTQTGAKSWVGVVRGKVVGALTGTTTVKARITFINAFVNPNGSNVAEATPDADGNFVILVQANADPADPPVEVLLNVGLGVAGATGDLYIQTMHTFPMQAYAGAGGEGWRATADVWTKYPAGLDLVAEHAKAGVIAIFNPAVSDWVREWLAATAPATGTHTEGSRVRYFSVAAGGPPGAICVTPGTPGTWKDLANVAA